jgi:hypothetical protein
LDAVLGVFPDALTKNPAAFFTACRDATPQLVARMMRYTTNHHDLNSTSQQPECPYPWIVSHHVTIECTKAMLEVYPQGVLQPSSLLKSYNLLDYFLMSPDMIEQRTFDLELWNKFKLILVAAESCNKDESCAAKCQISPVQTILKRVLSCSVLDDTKRAQHVLWLLHQLRWTDQWVFEKQSLDGRFPIHFVLSHKCTSDRSGLVAARELVKILLEAHPVSATHWIYGRLPLHMAIENGWPCHDLLLAIFPEALDSPDHHTDLFPFQTAAKHLMSSSSSPISLDVTYELLRANPTHASPSMGQEARRVRAQA